MVLLNRLIFLWHYGWLPEDVDHHPDPSTHNNRIENLRASTHLENVRNQRKPRHNTSGFKGVKVQPDGRYRARIGRNYRQVFLGDFLTVEEAALAYDAAAREFYGEFARTNFP
jgi:hypothetical protein